MAHPHTKPHKSRLTRQQRYRSKAPSSIGHANQRGTTVELQNRRAFALKLLSLGLRQSDVIEHLKQLGVGPSQARTAIQEAQQMIQQRHTRMRLRCREEQVERLEAYLYDAIVTGKPITDLVALEKLLADVQGTRAIVREEKPQERVRREALHAAIDSMTDDELDQIVDEELGQEM